jgi:hypothetical protein
MIQHTCTNIKYGTESHVNSLKFNISNSHLKKNSFQGTEPISKQFNTFHCSIDLLELFLKNCKIQHRTISKQINMHFYWRNDIGPPQEWHISISIRDGRYYIYMLQ